MYYPSRHELVCLAQRLAPELGFQGDISRLSAGLCHGLCCVMTEELIIGKMFALQQQLHHLKQLIDEQHILKPEVAIAEEDKAKLLDLVKRILIHHHPGKLLHLQKAERKVYNQEFMQTTHIAPSQELKAKGGVYEVIAFCGIYNLAGNDLQHYLRSLQEALALLSPADKNIPFSLELSNGNDATLLGYDPTQAAKPWFFCDFEASPLDKHPAEGGEISILRQKKFEDIEALTLALNIGLSRHVGATKDYVITTQFCCAGENKAVITALAHSFLLRLRERIFAIAGSYETADPYGETLFHMAASIGDNDTLRSLIQHGIPIDTCNEKRGTSALMCAALEGYIESAGLLIKAGAALNFLNPKDGFSPLMCAAQNDHPDIVYLLIQKGADLDLRNHDGWPALTIAAYKGHTAIVALLLQHQADPELCNPEGFSALMMAAQNGRKDCVNLLIESGAKLNQRNQNGYSAAMLAMRNQHEEIAIMLFEKNPDSILDIQSENTEIDGLLNLNHKLLQVMIDYMYTRQYAFYNKIDPLKKYLENHFTLSLFLCHHLEKSHKEQLIKLYIILRDDKERNEGELMASNSNTFFNTRYIPTVRSFNAIFRKECTYSEKRKAALLLLEAVENDEKRPQHPALEEGQLGKVAALCFPNKENKVQPEYSSSSSYTLMRGG